MEQINLLLLSLLGGMVGLLGGVVFLYIRKLSTLLEKYSIPFAAGILVTVSILGLMPEAIEHIGDSAYWVILTSFLVVYLFEYLFFQIHHHHGDHHDQANESSSTLVVIGDTIHNFIDGVAIGATFLISPGLGLATAISSFLHEVPHEVGDFGILLKAGWKRINVLLINLFSSLATVVGAFTIYYLGDNESLIGVLMAFSSGIFLYLGASDFLPRIEKNEKNKLKPLIPLLVGVVVMALIFILIPHSQ